MRTSGIKKEDKEKPGHLDFLHFEALKVKYFDNPNDSTCTFNLKKKRGRGTYPYVY